MRNKTYLNWILILVSFFTFGQKEKKDKIVLFENEKLKISFHDGKFEHKYKYERLDTEEPDTFSLRIFADKKIYLGKEANKNLNFKDLEEKYLKKAMEIENKLFHDISPEKKNFKIVHEVTNNQVYFYYYLAKTYYSAIICRKQKKDKEYDGWIFSGYKPFWFELILNNKVVVWKKYF